MSDFLRIAYRTMLDNLKTSLVVTLLFMGVACMYTSFYPAFKDYLEEMAGSMPQETRMIRGFESMTTYPGFLNVELYQVFWILILGILVGFIAASLVSREVEGKTVDLLLSTPVSRKQVVFEKYLGLVPFILLVDFATMLVVYGVTLVINETINLNYLFMTHVVSLPYFMAIAGVGLVVSVAIDEKMKASVIMIALVVAMFIFESISLMIPDYEFLGYVSLVHYYNPANILMEGEVDGVGIVIMLAVVVESLVLAILCFEHRDIAVS
ncbi:MAG TPA: hypothetical protein ENI42_01160 [Thermoplasmatales archaeon]|nr:hypothetical protein [Thermoplasmatales archaeon]